MEFQVRDLSVTILRGYFSLVLWGFVSPKNPGLFIRLRVPIQSSDLENVGKEQCIGSNSPKLLVLVLVVLVKLPLLRVVVVLVLLEVTVTVTCVEVLDLWIHRNRHKTVGRLSKKVWFRSSQSTNVGCLTEVWLSIVGHLKKLHHPDFPTTSHIRNITWNC